MQNSTTKSPRLYTELDLGHGEIHLPKEQAHYLKNVLRKNAGDRARLFNGRHGEWLYEIASADKKSATLLAVEQIKTQPAPSRRIHLYFAPIKKNRMDFLIEKAVELGATDFHPVLTQNTEVRKINSERLRAQIIEAAEQCERLDLPNLHDLEDMFTALPQSATPILAAIERGDHPQLHTIVPLYANKDIAGLVGPEGGFSLPELQRIATQENIVKVSLGDTILRAETAVLKFLCVL